LNPGILKAVFAFEVITILIEIQTNKFNLFAAMTVLFPMTMGVRMGA
jgi:hypothetical protein